MRLCRFGEARLGIVDPAGVRDVTSALDAIPAYRYPLPQHDVLIEHLSSVRARAEALAPAAPVIPLDACRLLSPVANPGKIIAAPVNYQQHLHEVRSDSQLHHGNVSHTITIHEAGVFLKASSSIAGAGEGIAIRKPDRRTDHEVELAVIIGRPASRVSREHALSYVAGYSIGLDITIRGKEDRSLRKSPDTHSILGPWLVTADELTDPGALGLEIRLNGELRQQSNTKYMILDVPALIELASSFYTLHPGDIIFTGTPEGVSPIQAGDTIVASVERIGTMEVRVRRGEAQEAEIAG
jgi:2-keto-4-pentenoate hydratase/2-oxohepta-3-ene-1,7-dioic acid hydratase in catechol pathway